MTVQKESVTTPAGAEAAARRRGRPRAYDPEAALQQATLAFWRAGYAATSLDTLTAATGMNRPSLYAACGDKHAWYLAALGRYVEAAAGAMKQLLARPEPLRQALQRVFDAALALYLPPDDAARGCLLSGTAATEAVADERIRAELGRGLRVFDRLFEQRLLRAQQDGELARGASAAQLARLASALLHSSSLRARAGDSRAEIAATIAAGLDLICGTGR